MRHLTAIFAALIATSASAHDVAGYADPAQIRRMHGAILNEIAPSTVYVLEDAFSATDDNGRVHVCGLGTSWRADGTRPQDFTIHVILWSDKEVLTTFGEMGIDPARVRNECRALGIDVP